MSEVKKAPAKLIKITLVKSTIGSTQPQIAVVTALGLKKIRQSRVIADTAIIRGMVNKVSHLLCVEAVKEA